MRKTAALAAATLVCAAPSGVHAVTAPRGPQPVVRLSLTTLGFPGFSKPFNQVGASMLTAHFVDIDHLLVTYSLRGLVERTAADVPEDDARSVAALLVEINTGKVLARTRWHLHDHGRYLWPLGHGRFLLRVRDNLRAIAPLENLAGNAFREMPMVRVSGRIDEVLVSPEGDLITLESSIIPKKPGAKAAAAIAFSGAKDAPPRPSEQINFIRVEGVGSPESPVVAVEAGFTHTRGPGQIPVNSRGYLYANQEGGRNNWNVQFDSFSGGAPIKLAPVMSTCPPRFEFLGYGQFLAFTCRRSDEQTMMTQYDFVPRETWEEPINGLLDRAYFIASAPSNRFAYSHEVGPVVSSFNGSQFGVPDTGQQAEPTQEIRVYQAESGDLLLKVASAPGLKAGQNFDLSPDGLSALVLQGAELDIYHLPELKKEDHEDMAEIKAHEPAVVTASRLEVRRVMKHAAAAEEPDALEGRTEAPLPAPAPTENNTIVNGDTPAASRRAAPSLLGPGESPPQ